MLKYFINWRLNIKSVIQKDNILWHKKQVNKLQNRQFYFEMLNETELIDGWSIFISEIEF